MRPILSITDVSASAMTAERMRMEVVANNIANAHTTRTAEGGPYRRQQVVFSALVRPVSGLRPGTAKLDGVQVIGVESDDSSEFPLVYQPGHPDADETGFVRYPNVAVATEMVDLITASRAYEANLQALKAFRNLTEDTFSLLRSLS